MGKRRTKGVKRLVPFKHRSDTPDYNEICNRKILTQPLFLPYVREDILNSPVVQAWMNKNSGS